MALRASTWVAAIGSLAAAMLFSGAGLAGARNVFAELSELPPPVAHPIDLSGPKLTYAQFRSVYRFDPFGHDEMIVFAKRPEYWAVLREQEAANYSRLFTQFGPPAQNFNAKLERALTIELGHLTINSKGIFLWY